ncbi:MAG TPA: hypothetical protein VF533_10005 [Solirubrobacteraceae bacterium]|jgi:hypothetical protein
MPSLPTAISLLALSIVVTGTAFAATGQIVNIADGSNVARIAHVSPTGSVQIGDGSGPLTVDGTTTSREALPTTFSTVATSLTSTDCTPIATPPTGRALIVKSISVDVFGLASPSGSTYVALGVACAGAAYVNPSSLGVTTIPFEPGYVVPAKTQLMAYRSGDVQAVVTVTGYTVPASQAPAAAASPQVKAGDTPPATDVRPR